MRTKRKWEEKFGYVLLAWMVTGALVIGIHIWQESMGEDGAWIWSCATMGNRECGPGEPLIRFRPGGGDD